MAADAMRAMAIVLAAACGAAVLAFPVRCPADSSSAPAPVPSPAVSPSPAAASTPAPGWHWALDGSNVFIDQAAGGPGVQPPEGPGFAAGAALSPNTPYDAWLSVPDTPGVAGALQYEISGTYLAKTIAASAALGLGAVEGSSTNAAFHGENLLPALNPFLGSTALPTAIVFPTHAGQDDGHAWRASLLDASIGSADGAWRLTGGYFNVAQTERFVFTQPALSNATPSIGITPAETLGDGPPTLDAWPTPPPGLPLLGADLTLHRGATSVELIDAALPALAGTGVRIAMGSVVVTHGDTGKYALQALHLWEGGVPISTTTMFGANAQTIPGPQGDLPLSTLGGQRQTIAAASATFAIFRSVAGLLEVGRAWYDADSVIVPGTQRPGGYYHLALTKTFGSSSASVEGFRFEPRYATAILPYGVPENVWSSAWSWPGPWLKSTYQLVDNSALGINRQGYRLKYVHASDAFAWRASYATYHQIDSTVLANVNQTGFVDGFFLPQTNGAGTLGIQHQYGAWLAWHPKFGDLTLDYINDTQHRDALPAYPADQVTWQAPQIVLTYSRHISPKTLVAAGFGRYAMHGTWATTPVDYGESVIFAGAQFVQSSSASLLVELRSTAFDGLPSIPPNGPPPNFGGTAAVVEQRIHL